MHGLKNLAVAESDDVKIQRTSPPQRASTAVERRAGGEYVVNEHILLTLN
jgi:hypothetical protein